MFTDLKCGLLASGGLGLDLLKQLADETSLNFVMTDGKSEEIIQFCQARDLPVFAGNPRGGRAAAFLQPFRTQVILSVNYLFIVEQDVLGHPEIIAANLHGSLLPKYRGRTPHVWAIINNEREAGVTAHVMEEGCDAGDILLQRRIPISETDTGGAMLEKYRAVYPDMVRELLDGVRQGTLTRRPQDNSRATYFGARTPEDGHIDWSWQRERIRNWIRAQARPYPGAFFYWQGQRCEVHSATFSDAGFDSRMPDGTVLSLNPLIVKTPNGALELREHSLPESVSEAAVPESGMVLE